MVARMPWAVAFLVCIFASFVPSLFAVDDNPGLNNSLLTVSWSGAIGMLALALAAFGSFLYSFTRP